MDIALHDQIQHLRAERSTHSAACDLARIDTELAALETAYAEERAAFEADLQAIPRP